MNPADAALLASMLGRRMPDAEMLGPGDWVRLADAACRHSLGPFVYSRLKNSLCGAPRAVTEQLHDAYVEAAAAGLRLRRDLAQILREFGTRGIRAVPLKGAYLADAVYGDAALRTMADIDLLVQQSDLNRAVDCLRALDYDAKYAFDPGAEQAVSQHMPPMTAERRAAVELHWTLANPGSSLRIGQTELDGIWSRVVASLVAGESAPALSPEDLLLHLCMHASVQHAFGEIGLRPFVDIAETVRRFRGALDWMELAVRANSWGAANGVRMALTLAQQWTDLAVPELVWSRLDGRPPDEQNLAWARRKVLEGGLPLLASGFPRLVSDAGKADTLSALRTALFPPRAEVARIYGVGAGSWRVLACYPCRFWDLWKKYRGALWKLLARDKTFMEQSRQEIRLREYLGRG